MPDAEPPGLPAEMLAEAAAEGVTVADAYQVTTVIPYTDRAPDVNRYTMPPQDLDEFFYGYHETGEIVVDVRPAGDLAGGGDETRSGENTDEA